MEQNENSGIHYFFSSLIDEKFPNDFQMEEKKMEESKLMITLSITHSLIQCESVGINEKKIVKKILFSSLHSFLLLIKLFCSNSIKVQSTKSKSLLLLSSS